LLPSTAADLVFILLDKPDESHDRMISEHIMRTHALAGTNKTSRKDDKGVDGMGTGTRGSQGTKTQSEEELGQSTLSQRLRRFVVRYEEGTSDIHQSHGDNGTFRLAYCMNGSTYMCSDVGRQDLLSNVSISNTTPRTVPCIL
jgi:hypothetical protein